MAVIADEIDTLADCVEEVSAQYKLTVDDILQRLRNELTARSELAGE